MSRMPIVAVAGCAALIIGGLALATAMPVAGTVIAIVGIVLLAGYLAAVFLLAWHGDQKRAWDPGSLRREHREEEAARRK
jgi:hypothetical protein